MINLKINGVPVAFIKAFTAADVQLILDFVRSASSLYEGTENKVLFIDTPITPGTVEAVEKLKAENFRVFFRDHHGIDGDAKNDRDVRVVAATEKLRRLLGDDCHITVRRLHPACSTLVEVGEFADAVAIIADPDADGLTAALKASGISYPELDNDAEKLDGEPKLQISGSPISQLLAKGIAAIPSYDAKRPKERENQFQKIFSDWVGAVEGNQGAMERLEKRLIIYEEAVETARALAAEAKVIAPGVVLIDTVDRTLFDSGTLHSVLEEDPALKVIIVRSSLGPIAAVHSIQYSFSVAKAVQASVDLRLLVPPDIQSGPQHGIISNVSFLLHTSEDVFKNEVMPRLVKTFVP